MDKTVLWSLRLGFSAKQAPLLHEFGISGFLDRSFSAPFPSSLPDFMTGQPRTPAEIKSTKQNLATLTPEELKVFNKTNTNVREGIKQWWLTAMMGAEFPLREKMCLLLQNHFVATFQKVNINHWIYSHNQLLREQAFGNFRELTKKAIQSNAVVRYLDNENNRKGKINENLSRELLELFTIGIGNYTESEVQNGARALAGLVPGDDGALYNPKIADDSPVTYFGKTGNFKADDLVDLIFEQPQTPYLFARKILQWFIYDNPDEKLVKYYGDFFRKSDYEIQPLLRKMFTEEYKKDTAGSKIKDPLTFLIQLIHETGLSEPDLQKAIRFLNQQGMGLYNQTNIKGWSGGKSWLTPDSFLRRNKMADHFCQGSALNKVKEQKSVVDLDWKKTTNVKIISQLCDRLLFSVDSDLQRDFESQLNYDFNPDLPAAENAVLRLFNSMIKTPEFQII